MANLGTGLMGSHLARRLSEAGLTVRAWNRSAEKARPLEAFGVRVMPDAAAAVEDADVVICMLTDAAAVEAVLFEHGAAEAMRPGSVVIDMSSIDPAVAQDHARRLADAGIDHLDAPVSGGTRGAADGSLAIMVGGDRAVLDRVRDVLGILGNPRYVGPSGSGQLAKLTNQVIVAINICAVAEALTFARRAGADDASVVAAIRGGFAESRVLDEHGKRMLERAFEPGGPVRLFLKDLRTALAVARREGLELPATEVVTGLYEQLLAHDGADLDHSAIVLEIERRNDAARADRTS